ncbi:hypothetical protein C0J52_16252 [Blattella germanica]|nr:hypothetical protein C0J52_16252 [Blattella germanica]
MGNAHSSFTEFLQKLQNDVAEVTRQIVRLDTGGSPEKKVENCSRNGPSSPENSQPLSGIQK